MLFSFSSPSFHSSFPTFPHFSLNSLLTICETYAMWLILEPPNLLCSLPHHRPHMFLWIIIVLCYPILVSHASTMSNLFIFVFSPNLCSPFFSVFLSFHNPLCSSMIITPVSLILPVCHFVAPSSSSLLHHPSLNPVELVFPPSLPFCFSRAPVTPSGVTRTVSDSRRTCYLVTRL